MSDPAIQKPAAVTLRKRAKLPDRKNLPQDVNSLAVATWPQAKSAKSTLEDKRDFARSFRASNRKHKFRRGDWRSDDRPFPPDAMGAVGPSQFFLFINGRLKTFNKATGAADGVINANPDAFFSSVMTPAVAANSTSNPQIRYDRLTSRWILTIIDTPGTSAATLGDTPNRILIAVSDAASAGVITGGTVWTFFFVQQNTVGGGDTGEFLDNPSLGVDNNALYIGGDMSVAASGAFVTTSGFVVRKSSILGGGPIVVTAFRGLITGGDGPESPRGVDNYNAAANEGYFIGSSVGAFGRMIMRRVATPGATPTISANIPITVATTSFPPSVPHLGNTGGLNGQLDALDDRLFAAHIRNGRLWTAHNIAVDTNGVASSAAGHRNAVRWYEFIVPVGSGTPTVNQSGTIFDSAASNPKFYWNSTAMISGQGHAAFGFSVAGNNDRINAGTNGRLVGDSLGTQGAVSLYTEFEHCIQSAWGFRRTVGAALGRLFLHKPRPERRHDDVDHSGILRRHKHMGRAQVAKLLAPPPATPASASPPSVASGQSSVAVTVTGTSVAGSGFLIPARDLQIVLVRVSPAA